jgi:RNA polymerase-associated protein RTF1
LLQLKSQQKDDEKSEEESDLDFGSDADDDSASDYEEEEMKLKPWQQKKKTQKATSRLDSYEERSEASDEEMEDVSARAPAVEAELEDYLKVTLPRRRLARWCNEPFFDQAVLRCFVRLFIGESDDRKKCYRLCEIVGVEKSRSEYKFPTTTSHEKPVSKHHATVKRIHLPQLLPLLANENALREQITTSKALRLKIGKNEKSFPMYLVSDSRPTEDDVRNYVSVQKASRQDVLGRREATRLRKKQDELVNNYTYTQADIEKNVAERKQTGKALTNLGLEQTRVAIVLQAAHSALDDAKRRLEDAKRAHLEAPEDSEELKNAIEEAEDAVAEAKAGLEEKKEEEKRILAVVEKRKKKLSRRQKDQNWAKVNERAAKMNQNADFESYKEQQAKKEAEAKSGSEPRFNPYARRKVKPKILWEVGQKEEKKDDDATKAVDNETREDAGTTESIRDDQVMNDVPQEDVLASQQGAFIGERHQFSIDDEALAPDATSILGTNRKKQNTTRVRKGLSLAQYQERKAVGTL